MQNLPLVRIVGVLFGIAFLGVGVAGAQLGLDAQRWPQAEGRIVESEPVGMGDHQSARIVAEFRYGSALVRCSHVAAGRDNRPSEARDYPIGGAVRVSYNPQNPSQCVLRPGVSGGSMAFAMTGLGAFAMAFYAHRALRRQAA